MTAQPVDGPDEPQVQIPARELRRLRALERLASAEELQEAEAQARLQELDALEEAGLTGALSVDQAQQMLGVPERNEGTTAYLTTDDVRARLGLPR